MRDDAGFDLARNQRDITLISPLSLIRVISSEPACETLPSRKAILHHESTRLITMNESIETMITLNTR